MIIKTYYTRLSWETAVEQMKCEGHSFLGYTWNAACFKDIIIVRSY